MKHISSLLLAAALLAAGCGGSPKRIDGTSMESMRKSVDEIKKTLSAEEKAKLDEAVMTIGVKYILGDMFKEGTDGEKEALKLMNGKTAAEVIAAAEKIRSESKK